MMMSRSLTWISMKTQKLAKKTWRTQWLSMMMRKKRAMVRILIRNKRRKRKKMKMNMGIMMKKMNMVMMTCPQLRS
jgi:hypothetical protein